MGRAESSGNSDFDPVFETAFEVSEWLLQVTRDAYLERNFDKFARRNLLPQTLGNFDGDKVIHTRAELERIFSAMLEHFQIHGITDLKRHTIAANFLSPTEIEATFVSQHVSRGYMLSEEIAVHGKAKLVDGLWKIAEGRYATNIEQVSRALIPKKP